MGEVKLDSLRNEVQALKNKIEITPKLARALRARGYDVISAHKVGMAEASDAEHLALAAAQGAYPADV